MPAYFALATSVGLLAVLDTWLFVSPLAATLPGLVWISFIAWGCHFHSGGGVKGSTTAVVGMSFGALVGMVAVMLASGPLAGAGDFAAPIAVAETTAPARTPRPIAATPAAISAAVARIVVCRRTHRYILPLPRGYPPAERS